MNSDQRLYPDLAERRHSRSLKAKLIATRGEAIAADFLEANNYTILARNYRAGRAGEVDIVAMDPHFVVTFVEVKTRTIDGPVFGIPEIGFEAVSYRKQRRILSVSHKFMAQPEFAGRLRRYDVIVIAIARADPEKAELTQVMDAFT